MPRVVGICDSFQKARNTSIVYTFRANYAFTSAHTTSGTAMLARWFVVPTHDWFHRFYRFNTETQLNDLRFRVVIQDKHPD